MEESDKQAFRKNPKREIIGFLVPHPFSTHKSGGVAQSIEDSLETLEFNERFEWETNKNCQPAMRGKTLLH